MKTCIATIPSLNICIRAQRALADNGLYCRIVSIDPRLTRRGCTYGIEFSCAEEREIKAALRRAGIGFSQILTNSEGGLI